MQLQKPRREEEEVQDEFWIQELLHTNRRRTSGSQDDWFLLTCYRAVSAESRGGHVGRPDKLFPHMVSLWWILLTPGDLVLAFNTDTFTVTVINKCHIYPILHIMILTTRAERVLEYLIFEANFVAFWLCFINLMTLN